MKLFIAEKPNMGRSIAKCLPGPHVKKDGYIETAGGYVTWCVGHLLETAPPEAYDKKYEQFPGKFEDLPIIPTEWILQIYGDKKKQVTVVKDLLKKCTEVVNAGDPGREGQLIVDELLEFLGNRKPVKRILLNALDDVSIKRELANLHDNTKFFPLYQAGLGRQRADWTVGMNMSRIYTILGQSAGYRGVLSVGRVQSPTLAIVVRRDNDIESFVPIDYWSIKATMEGAAPSEGPKEFPASWMPHGVSDENPDEDDEEEPAETSPATPAAARPAWLDEKNRIISKEKADEIVAKTNGKPGVVTEAVRKRTQEQPPLPFDLSTMQIHANSKWGASVQETLQACQSIYEKGFATYPRTDCQFLPESQLSDCAEILSAISSAVPSLSAHVASADQTLKSRAWNDAKLGEHHAIIPTRLAPDLATLTPLEKSIYEAAATRYLAQFLPPAEVDKAKLEMDVAGERFVSRGRSIVSPGWRVLFGGQSADESDEKKGEDDAILPGLNQNDPILCKKSSADAKKTTPPPRFTQGSLLDAMKKVHLLVDDPAVKKKLKTVEGIGRSATRAAIIETLLKRGFLEQKGKQIISSQIGRALVAALPPRLIDPALTAMWETALDAVASGKADLGQFMTKQSDWVLKLIESAKGQKIENLPQGYSSPRPASAGGKPSGGKASGGAGKPAAKGKTCPKCKKGQMVKRTAKSGANAGKEFYGCTNYPECKHAEPVK